jgi:hypothetical protein
MNCVLLLIAALLAVVYAQSPPVIPSDFSGDVVLIETRGHFRNGFEGLLYESFSTKRQRIDVIHTHERVTHVELLRLYNNHVEYDAQEGDSNPKCFKKQFNQTMHAAFAWLANAKVRTGGVQSRV